MSVAKVEIFAKSRSATNPKVRKSLQNLCEIDDLHVFEVATASIFLVLDGFPSVFWLRKFAEIDGAQNV